MLDYVLTIAAFVIPTLACCLVLVRGESRRKRRWAAIDRRQRIRDLEWECGLDPIDISDFLRDDQ